MFCDICVVQEHGVIGLLGLLVQPAVARESSFVIDFVMIQSLPTMAKSAMVQVQDLNMNNRNAMQKNAHLKGSVLLSKLSCLSAIFF